MELLKFPGKEKLPSIINDPFNKTSIKKIHVTYEDFWGRGEWKAYGYVYFKNGNTSGDQRFEAETFDEVVIQIKTFIETL